MTTFRSRDLDARLAPYGPLVLRLGLGAVFIAHAYAKAAIFTFQGTESYFEAHGFPAWAAYPVFLAELLGGLAIAAGLRARIAALALIPVMIGALEPHLANGWMFTGTGGGWEYVAFLIVALSAQALVGSGALSVDDVLVRARRVAAPAPA